MRAKALPWILKYRPKRVEDVADQEQAKRVLIPWIRKWLTGNVPEKKGALLWGPPGTGKTSLVEAIANEYKLELVEMNASDFRRKTDIQRIAKAAATRKPLPPYKGRIVLLDEVDGLSPRSDEGAIQAIVELLEVAKNPIIMTANDPWEQHLRPIRERSIMVEFKRLNLRDAVSVLKRICEAERLQCDDKALKLLVEKNYGDLRGSINDLQSLAEISKRITPELVQRYVVERDRTLTPWEMLQRLFYAKYAWQAKKAVGSVDIDYDTLYLWIEDNVIRQYGDDPEDLWRAMEALSRATVYLGRIRKTMDWSLLAYYYDMVGPGVALARKKYHRRAKFGAPERLILLARSKEERQVREELVSYLARLTHTSRSDVRLNLLPLLRLIFTSNPRYAAKLALGLNLSEKMIKYLAGTKYREVKKFMEKMR